MRTDMNVESLCYLVAALCVLHDICELKKADFLEEWLEDVRNAVEQSDNIPLAIPKEREASNTRETLLQYFSEHLRTGTFDCGREYIQLFPHGLLRIFSFIKAVPMDVELILLYSIDFLLK